ncbi:MAG TPA: hypothetical protein VF666_07400 [Pyrinomonadaceae bacterium]|jgi:hypothetical protein
MLAALTVFGGAIFSSSYAQTPIPKKDSKEPTAEQISELVVYIYGSRERMAQIQRNGVERGRTTRINDEGRTEEISYERRFVRGETSDKDKIRLDQKLPNAEYALIYNAGRVWGSINGTTFTPRQEAVNDFLAQTKRGISNLLRYKENGATLTYVGKDKQKGIDMWIVDLVEKDQQRTRFYISSQKYRVLWLEYEETPAGVASKPVQVKKTFHDYRYAQGQLVPFRTVVYEDGKQSEETNVLNVSFGLKMDDSYFQDTPTTADAQP